MELDFLWLVVAVIVGTLCAFKSGSFIDCLIKRMGKKQMNSPLPPGDMGWPLIGNMLSFVRAFKSQNPESFINNLKKRYGQTGIYRTNLFWSPSIIVCSPELCRAVLTDDEQFKMGYPLSTLVSGGTPFDYISGSGHRRIRRLTTSGFNGHEKLSTYVGSIEDIVITKLEEWTDTNKPIQFFSEMNKIAFRVIMTIFLGSASDESVIVSLEKYYKCVFNGLFCTPINIPGFAFHRALKGRKMLAKTIKALLAERREQKSNDPNSKRGLIDLIKELGDEEGENLDDDQIVIVLLLYLLAGHETTGRAATWATIYLHDHPEVLQKAKEEQEEIIKRRPISQKGLTLCEIKQMKYLSKVIDETLRIRTNSFALFREAKIDTNLNGYFIPKGWKVLVFHSAVHMDPEIYSNPEKFLPSRWDDLKLKPGAFQPFGAGTSTCPGADLTKLEICIFLHYFLLNYKLEQLNPGGPVSYLPSPDPADNCPARIIKVH
ncbi:hypothetical protein PTKIN_Ptkin05aG0015000 [Pterospermum kingtungense]